MSQAPFGACTVASLASSVVSPFNFFYRPCPINFSSEYSKTGLGLAARSGQRKTVCCSRKLRYLVVAVGLDAVGTAVGQTVGAV